MLGVLPVVLEVDFYVSRCDKREIWVVVEPATEVDALEGGGGNGRVSVVTSEEDGFASCFSKGHSCIGGYPAG